MHGLEHDNGNFSYADYRLFLLDLNGPANWGKDFSDLDSVHGPPVWKAVHFLLLFLLCPSIL